jgi:hypothetical protein
MRSLRQMGHDGDKISPMPEANSDMGAETARFQAFAARRDDELPPPWQMRARGSKVVLLVAIVVVVAILAVIFGVVLAS